MTLKIGEKIRVLRESKNMTRKELASILNITVSALELIENDKNKSITVNRLQEIAILFNVSIAYFFDSNNQINLNQNNPNSALNINSGCSKDNIDKVEIHKMINKATVIMQYIIEKIRKNK
jgi:transcriptional regulator with XRE-family HTH domain